MTNRLRHSSPPSWVKLSPVEHSELNALSGALFYDVKSDVTMSSVGTPERYVITGAVSLYAILPRQMTQGYSHPSLVITELEVIICLASQLLNL
jgi:hypothetical protein